MEKLFEIASSITNPISLTALFFLILYLLFKGVIDKIEPQKGNNGHQLLKQLMRTVAVIAIITLILVFGLKAYQVYDNVSDLNKVNEILEKNKDQIGKSTDTIGQKLDSTSQNIIKEVNKEDLTVKFSINQFTDVNLLIGNNGGKIILMRNLKIYWNYSKCPQFKPLMLPAVLVEYRYRVSLTEGNGNKLIDNTKEFKYGTGEIDNFNVDLDYPALGVYTIWFSFEYKTFGSDEWSSFKTGKEKVEKCMK